MPQRSFLFLAVAALAVAACAPDAPADEMTAGTSDTDMTLDGAVRFSSLALDCMHREYPNKLGQVLKDETRLLPPRTLHPAFFGCFDWHSSVHGHWMLVRLLRDFPDHPDRQRMIDGLSRSLSSANIAGEVDYFATASPSWERTYGWAWLLQLAAELHTWKDPVSQEWAGNLAPLAKVVRDRYLDFLPRQEYPVRTGVHPNTAFGLSFAFDYAKAVGDDELLELLRSSALRYYSDDRDCPLSWEPSGEDFLSPCFEEAALMARVMPASEFRDWLAAFLPSLANLDTLEPANVSDRSDPKIVHLDGLNLSRAWNLYVIAGKVDEGQAAALRGKAAEHLNASLPHITSEHYEGSHWLGSFAVYALTRNR